MTDDPRAVDHEGGPLADPSHPEGELSVQAVIGGRYFFVKIAQQIEVQLLIFPEPAQGEGRIDRNAEHHRVQIVIRAVRVTNAAQLSRTDAGESQGKE
jgi:hypothetical protein